MVAGRNAAFPCDDCGIAALDAAEPGAFAERNAGVLPLCYPVSA